MKVVIAPTAEFRAEQEEITKRSEAHDRRIRSNAAIGAAQAEAVRIAIADSDRGTLLDIATSAANLDPLYLVFNYLAKHEDQELRTLSETRWHQTSPYYSREYFKK